MCLHGRAKEMAVIYLCTRGLRQFSVFVKCVSTAGPKRWRPFCFIVEFPKTDQTQACRLTASTHMWNFQALTLLVEAGLTSAPVDSVRGLGKISQFGCLSNVKFVSTETNDIRALTSLLAADPVTPDNQHHPTCLPPDNKHPPALPCPAHYAIIFYLSLGERLLKGGNKTKVLKKIILLRPLNLII